MTETPPYLVLKAAELAHTRLATSSERLEHSRAVARLAGTAGTALGYDAESLGAAGWLHDLGYASSVTRTGFHPLDGALHLMRAGWPDLVIQLVAHHSHAVMLADAHGLGAQYALIDPAPAKLADVLTWADLSAGIDGSGTTPLERVDEMRLRHSNRTHLPPELREARYTSLLQAANRVEQRLGAVLADSAEDAVRQVLTAS